MIVPSYYGKNCVTGIGLKKSLSVADQPDLVKTDKLCLRRDCQVQWSFATERFSPNCLQGQESGFDGQNEIGLGHRFPPFHLPPGTTPKTGTPDFGQCEVDDFQASWGSFETVTDDPITAGMPETCIKSNISFAIPLNMAPGSNAACPFLSSRRAFADE